VAELEQVLADLKTSSATNAAEAADLAAAFTQDAAHSTCRNALRAHEYDETLSAVRRSAAADAAAQASSMDGLRATHSSELERLIAAREVESAASERKLQHAETQVADLETQRSQLEAGFELHTLLHDAAMKAAEEEAQARVSSQAILRLIVTFRWFCDRLLVITGGGRGCAEDEDACRNKMP
jgi:uncharacterized protein (DUF3084 family)